jgi:protein-L-isoaspartate(D-aspartate) O-methyltransferase
MLQAARLERTDAVLDVGTGSGYAAAVASRIVRHVYTIERHGCLVEKARRRFAELGYQNIACEQGDGTKGWPEMAPFNAILVSAGAPDLPEAHCRQLKIGGRLVIPVGSGEHQDLVRAIRRSATEYSCESLGGVVFVPLIGAHGWPGPV